MFASVPNPINFYGRSAYNAPTTTTKSSNRGFQFRIPKAPAISSRTQSRRHSPENGYLSESELGPPTVASATVKGGSFGPPRASSYTSGYASDDKADKYPPRPSRYNIYNYDAHPTVVKSDQNASHGHTNIGPLLTALGTTFPNNSNTTLCSFTATAGGSEADEGDDSDTSTEPNSPYSSHRATSATWPSSWPAGETHAPSAQRVPPTFDAAIGGSFHSSSGSDRSSPLDDYPSAPPGLPTRQRVDSLLLVKPPSPNGPRTLQGMPVARRPSTSGEGDNYFSPVPPGKIGPTVLPFGPHGNAGSRPLPSPPSIMPPPISRSYSNAAPRDGGGGSSRSVRWNERLICPSPILSHQRRQGWYNRRGDQLWTNEGSFKPAPSGQEFPLDLGEYPEFGEGWQNEHGVRIDMHHRLIPKVPLRPALKRR